MHTSRMGVIHSESWLWGPPDGFVFASSVLGLGKGRGEGTKTTKQKKPQRGFFILEPALNGEEHLDYRE